MKQSIARLLKTLIIGGTLCTLFLGSCTRKEVLPEPNQVPTATIDKIKAWYEPKIARLRGAKDAGASVDIYLPQWGDGKLYTLPTGERIALFPVHRERSVRYYDIGFVRRFVVCLDDKDNVKSVKLLEMVGKKEYLRDHKEEVALRYYQGNTQDMPAFAWQQDIELQIDKGPSPTCKTIGISVDECWMTSHVLCGSIMFTSKSYVCTGSGGGGIGGSGIIYDLPDSDTGGGGGSGGGSGTGTPSKTDIGDNTNIILPPPNVSPELLKITKNWYTLSNAEWVKVDAVFKKGLQNPMLRKMYDEIIKDPTFKIHIGTFQFFGTADESEGLGRYRSQHFFDNSPNSYGIQLNQNLFGDDPAYTQFFMVTLWAEMTHAYQHYAYGDDDYEALANTVNLECEQRFFIEFVEYMSRDANTDKTLFGLRKGYSFYGTEDAQKELKVWLDNIKNSPAGKPTLDNVQPKYSTFFMPTFKELWKNTKYGTMPILPDKILDAILFLFQ